MMKKELLTYPLLKLEDLIGPNILRRSWLRMCRLHLLSHPPFVPHWLSPWFHLKRPVVACCKEVVFHLEIINQSLVTFCYLSILYFVSNSFGTDYFVITLPFSHAMLEIGHPATGQVTNIDFPATTFIGSIF